MTDGSLNLLLVGGTILVATILVIGIGIVINTKGKWVWLGGGLVALAFMIALVGLVLSVNYANGVKDKIKETARTDFGIENPTIKMGSVREFEVIGKGEKYEVYYDIDSKNINFVKVSGGN